MSARPQLSQLLRLAAAWNLAIDRQTVEIAESLAAAGVESLVLKGPVLAEWLYPGEVRPYGDSDLMLRAADWERAVALIEGMGFRDYLGAMAHPRMESFAGTGFSRAGDSVDLHCTLHGLTADPEDVWSAFAAGEQRQSIGGAELRVPNRPALLLHIALHAAHHHEGKALEDLRRAIAGAGEDLWAEALGVAQRLGGLPTFASGLRLVPEGEQLAHRLRLGEVRSVAHEIRFTEVPMAEAMHELLAPGLGLRRRLAVVASELAPRPDFMRWWSPLARRGRLGLLLSYAWRWIWLLANAPRALVAVRRTRRRS